MYATHSEQEKTFRTVEEVIADGKLFRASISGWLVYSHWRCAKAAEIRNADLTNSIGGYSIGLPKGNLV